MKKIIFYTLITICTLTNSFSQDMITKKTGEDINAKILEVTNSEIKYKRKYKLNNHKLRLIYNILEKLMDCIR